MKRNVKKDEKVDVVDRVDGASAEAGAPRGECYLRKTKVKLLDGRVYDFRALPFTEEAVDVLEVVMDGGGGKSASVLRSMLKGVRMSLSYGYSDVEVDGILERGLIPLMPGEDGSEEDRVYEEVLEALVAQLGGG